MLHMHACSAVEMENGAGQCHPVNGLGPLCAPFVALLTRPCLISWPPFLAASLLPSCSGPLADLARLPPMFCLSVCLCRGWPV